MKYKRVLSLSAVFLWMALIFYLSHQQGEASSSFSSGLLHIIVHVLDVFLPFFNEDSETLHFLLRKSAHFTAYMILGMLVVNALRFIFDTTIRTLFFGLCICVLYAISDEVHQLFIPGRSGEVMDIFIDSVGAMFGITLFTIIKKQFTAKLNNTRHNLN